MPSFQFDADELFGAAGAYEQASAQASAAQSALSAPALSTGAVGGTSASQALAAALQAFHATHSEVAAGNASALVAFAQRLRSAGSLADESTSATTEAAGQG